MTAVDLAAVLVSVAALGAFAALIVTVHSTLRTLRDLRSTLDEIRAQAGPLVTEMSYIVSDAGAEVERVEELISSAASIQHTVESASRLTYLAFSNPLIKVVAFFRGLRRGVGRALMPRRRRSRRISSRRRQRENKQAA